MDDSKNNIMPTYDIGKSYEYNFEYGPFYNEPYPQPFISTRSFKLLDFHLNSPFGVAAGLLLNSKWVNLYANLGFDILTYKTVRSVKQTSHPYPNCVHISKNSIVDLDDDTPLIGLNDSSHPSIDELSITNSFGVPSALPEYWQTDVEKAKSCLKKGQVLIVSVVGTTEDNNDLISFVNDFKKCSLLAKEAGADIIELDFSCPNSPAAEGELFKNPKLSSIISKAVKDEIRSTPLFLKIGFINNYELLDAFIKANAPFIDGVVGINTIKKRIITPDGNPALPGKGREESGVCGAKIRQYGFESAKSLLKLRRDKNYDFAVIGVGGAMTPEHINQYLDLGVDAVQAVTAPMFDPHLAFKFKQQLENSERDDDSRKAVLK
jgi:dihydroorotate dehydrogenase (NAD+) catalytic subunit